MLSPEEIMQNIVRSHGAAGTAPRFGQGQTTQGGGIGTAYSPRARVVSTAEQQAGFFNRLNTGQGLAAVDLGGIKAFSPKSFYKSGMDTIANIAKSGRGGAGWGILAGLGAAGVGTAAYGVAKMIAPNNVDMANPGERMVKGAMYGAAFGGAVAMARNAEKFVGTMAAPSNWMKNVAEGAGRMTKSGKGVAATGIALGMAFMAGSGDFKMGRSLNPVESV